MYLIIHFEKKMKTLSRWSKIFTTLFLGLFAKSNSTHLKVCTLRIPYSKVKQRNAINFALKNTSISEIYRKNVIKKITPEYY